MKGKRIWKALATILIVAGSAFGFAPRPDFLTRLAAHPLCASAPSLETALVAATTNSVFSAPSVEATYEYYQSPTWLTADPLGEAGGLNLTVAFADDPVNSVDPDGLAVGDWWDWKTYWQQSIGFTKELLDTQAAMRPDKLVEGLRAMAATIPPAAFPSPAMDAKWRAAHPGVSLQAIQGALKAKFTQFSNDPVEREQFFGRLQFMGASFFIGTGEATAPARTIRLAEAVSADALMVRQREEAMRIYTQIIKDGNAAHLRALESEKIRSQQWFSHMTFVNPAAGKETAFAAYIRQVERLDVSTARNGAVLYSGKGNRALAEQFAVANGRTTLEMTPGGAWLDQQQLFNTARSGLTREQAIEVWSALSRRFANGASGTAVGFVDGAAPGSVFNLVEYPALLDNAGILNVITGGH